MSSKMDNISKKLNLFFYNYEYQILELAGMFCGLMIVAIANMFFITTKFYYLVFFFGFLVGALGFVIEYFIKVGKKKAIETEFGYFLKDLSREYSSVNSLSVALSNISDSNFYGNINVEIKRLANRVSWGETFEEALNSINESIKSPVIKHCLLLLDVLEDSAIPFQKVLLNLSKDVDIFKSEARNKKYFVNLFGLSIVFYFLFMFVLLYLDFLVGRNFLWFTNSQAISRVFFDNFLLYIALLLSFFTAYVMYSITEKKSIEFLKYVTIFFLLTTVLFQVFIPKPDAADVLVSTIDYLVDSQDVSFELENVIALQSISAKYIVDNTEAHMVYFWHKEQNRACGIDCAKYTIIVTDPQFFDFEIQKMGRDYYIYYKEK